MASQYGFKRPRTTQEMRQSFADGDLVRAARTYNTLPNYYDDRPRARQPRPDRYKNHRRS